MMPDIYGFDEKEHVFGSIDRMIGDALKIAYHEQQV
jgi:hypothetical protein